MIIRVIIIIIIIIIIVVVVVVVVVIVASHKLVGDYPSLGRSYWFHKL